MKKVTLKDPILLITYSHYIFLILRLFPSYQGNLLELRPGRGPPRKSLDACLTVATKVVTMDHALVSQGLLAGV
jgi:hypothetical protein